jgi:hypothetical protein
LSGKRDSYALAVMLAAMRDLIIQAKPLKVVDADSGTNPPGQSIPLEIRLYGGAISEGIRKEANNSSKRVLVEIGRQPIVGESRKLPIQLPNKLYRIMSFSDIKNGDTQVRLVIKFEATIAYELR